jgi:hypothetical protein
MKVNFNYITPEVMRWYEAQVPLVRDLTINKYFPSVIKAYSKLYLSITCKTSIKKGL